MREFQLSVDADFTTGLQRSIDVMINTPGAVELYNAKLNEYGVRDWESPVEAFAALELTQHSVVIAAPYPQLFHGRSKVFCAFKGQLFEVDTTTWDLLPITTYDGYDTTVAAAITLDGVWDFIDLNDNYMFFNGTSWVYKTSNEALKGGTDKTLVVTTPNITSAARFHGHVMYGGFSGTVWNAEWQAAWKALQPENVGILQNFDNISSNYVWWTSAAGGDLLWLIYPQLAFAGPLNNNYDAGEPYFIRQLQRGDWGWMPVDFKGPIMRLVKYENGVCALGQDGVCIMPYNREVTTFGKIRTSLAGLQQRGAVAASDTELVYIDPRNDLYTIANDGKITLLGYRQYLSEITDDDVNIHWDAVEGDFYICSEDRTFILNRHGMSEVGRIVTGVVNYGTHRRATYEETGTAGAENLQYTYTSGIRDAGSRALKTIVQLDVALDSGDTSTVTVAIDYRYKHNADFVRTAFMPLNDEGIVSPTINCLEFRYVIRSTNYRTLAISSVKYTVQYDDLRTIRGLQE